jgi:hypothetical protein
MYAVMNSKEGWGSSANDDTRRDDMTILDEYETGEKEMESAV